jgi:WhiB family redox-sensing transcriptional regulator
MGVPVLTVRDTIRERATNGSWRQLGRCRGVDPEIFYPPDEGDEAQGIEAAETAKAICAVCPVREACLEHALGTREKHGIWGGLTERERRRVLRQRRKSA